MDKKTIGIIIIIIGLILVVGIFYFIFFYKFSLPIKPTIQQPTTITQPQPLAQPTTAPLTGATVKATSIKKTEVNQDDLARIASAFAERFGSYSNQSDYGNVRDLKLFMSSKMQNWADNYISKEQAANQQTAIYYGITTKAIAAEVKQFDNESGQAEILIKNQRREATGATANATTFYQDIIIKFIREKNVWKVDNVYWQKKQ
ncbi:MAG: hypothetical protein AAB653_00430 [Patescibacteria group bacterium]